MSLAVWSREFTIKTRLALNLQQFSCLCLLKAGVTGVGFAMPEHAFNSSTGEKKTEFLARLVYIVSSMPARLHSETLSQINEYNKYNFKNKK